MGRRVNSNLPVKTDTPRNGDLIKSYLEQRQDVQMANHDTHTKDFSSLVPGQTVRIQDQNTGHWTPGNMVSQCEPRSCIVSTPNGSTLRRKSCNCVHLRESTASNPVQKYATLAPDTESPSSPYVEPTTTEKHTDDQSGKTRGYTDSSGLYHTSSGHAVIKPDRLSL